MRLRHFILLALCLLATGCSLLIRTPEVTVRDVSLLGLDDGGVTIEFRLAVSNPNPFALALKGYRYNLDVYALPFAKAEGRETITFPSHGVAEVRLPVRIGYRNLVELLKRHPDPDNVPYRLSAGFEVGTPLGTTTVPVEKSGAFAIPKRLQPDYILHKLSELVNGGH
jgi:LEA14-like dessication related protein